MSEKQETPFDPTSLPSLDPTPAVEPRQAQPAPNVEANLPVLQPVADDVRRSEVDDVPKTDHEADSQLPDLAPITAGDTAGAPDAAAECDPELPDLGSSADEAHTAPEASGSIPADAAAGAEDEPEPDSPTEAKADEKRALRKKRLITGAVIAGALTVGGITTYNFIIPAINYHRADAAFAEGSYAEARELFVQARTFKDAEERADESQRGVHYLRGKKAMKQREHDRAEREFKKAGSFKDADDLEKEAHNAYHYQIATELQEKKDHAGAGAEFAGLEGYKDSRDKAAACASELFKEQSYAESAEIYEKLGKDYQKKAKEARTHEGYLKAFQEAAEKLDGCDPDGALKLLKPLPEKFSHDKRSVATLRSQCQTAKEVAKGCGHFRATTSSEFRVTQTHDSTGIYEYWYNNDTGSSSLDIRYDVESDGTITVRGSVSFWRYTNYSTLSEYLDMTSVTKTFSVKKAKSVPASIKVGDGVTLTRNGSTWKLKFSERDASSSMHFTYDYTANYTYKK